MPGTLKMTVAEARARGLLPAARKRPPRRQLPPAATVRSYAVCGPGRRCPTCAAWLAQQGLTLPRWMGTDERMTDANPFFAL
jgi:hypothetical protein